MNLKKNSKRNSDYLNMEINFRILEKEDNFHTALM